MPVRRFEVVNGNEPEESYSEEMPQIDPVKNLILERIENNRLKEKTCPLDLDDLIDTGRSVQNVQSTKEDDEDDFISDRMKKNLQEIVAQYPSGLWCSALPEQYLVSVQPSIFIIITSSCCVLSILCWLSRQIPLFK